MKKKKRTKHNPNIVLGFFGRYRFLSNFYPSPVLWEGVEYPTVEHAYQAAKCKFPSEADRIRKKSTPAMAKYAGRYVTLKSDWAEIRLAVMDELLRQKFGNDPLRLMLLRTAPKKLIEENTWNDRYWGTVNGEGRNILGKLLMRIRKEILDGTFIVV